MGGEPLAPTIGGLIERLAFRLAKRLNCIAD